MPSKLCGCVSDEQPICYVKGGEEIETTYRAWRIENEEEEERKKKEVWIIIANKKLIK